MENDGQNFKEMFNTMKVEEHREKKQEKQVKKIFEVLRKKRCDKYENHYKVSLYAKVFKGLMVNRLLLDSFAERLENVYVDILMRTHFNAMKGFKIMKEEDRHEKCKMTLIMRKRNSICNFKKIVDAKFIKREEARRAKQILERQQLMKAKTEQNFYQASRSRSPLRPAVSTRPLEDSRRSAYSAFSNISQFQRRKFTAIKQLPQRPNLQSVVEQEQSPLVDKDPSWKDEHESRVEVFRGYEKIDQIRENDPSVKRQASQSNKIEKSMSTPEKSWQLNYDKQKILWLLCQLKVLEIGTLSSIVEQYSQSLKNQSTLTEKSLISKSKATLKDILSITTP